VYAFFERTFELMPRTNLAGQLARWGVFHSIVVVAVVIKLLYV